jgi:acyl-CoA synthetase (NDP forming)
VAVACEDGGLGLALLQQAVRRDLGVSLFVSLGDRVDVSAADFLQYIETSPRTGTVLLYLERFDSLNRSAELLRRVGRSRPIVVVTAGHVAAGPAPDGSHTARLASRGAGFDALCGRSGVIRAGTIDEMLDVAACLDLQPLPRGPRVALVSDAAAAASFAGAAATDAGLTVTSVKTCAAAHFAPAVEASLTSTDADALIVLCASAREFLAEPFDAIREGVARARTRGADKPVLICVPAVDGLSRIRTRAGEAMPVFGFPENALRALGLVAAYARWRRESPGLFWGFDDVNADDARDTCRQVAEARGDTWLTGEEVRRVLNDFGLPLVPSPTARSEDEAAALAAILGYPVVLKVASPAVLHKTEAGAVKVNLGTESAVRFAYRELAARFPDARPVGADASIVVQPMVGDGVETLVGVAVNAATGPLVGFGLGGGWAEALRDVAFRSAPLTDADADRLIHDIRGSALLRGYRGAEPGDIDALREILLRVSSMCTSVREIQEVDLNPTVVLPAGHGCRIVDARIRVRPV